MKRIRLYTVLLILSISSLFFIKGIYGIFTIITFPSINILTISQESNYIVIHETMDLNGTTYTEHSRTSSTGLIGDTISPTVLTITGFNSPSVQTAILDTFEKTITYRYPRKQYTLTINNSEHVTTTTPSGTYYYGQPIHLEADATDSEGNPFIKWSDETNNPIYDFTITGDKTIEPIYEQGYAITYKPNNGDSDIIRHVVQTHSLGTIPEVTYDDCVGNTGDYHTRGCTYVHEFLGWFTEPTFINQVDETFVPTSDMTLYAKWNKIYFANDGPFTCTGTNKIDTGIIMFNQLNATKDFIITFTVDQNNGYNTDHGDRGAIFADMNEVGEPFPGITFFTTNNTSYTMNINIQGHKVKDSNTGYVTGQSVVIKKELGKVYYSYNGGPDILINDFSNFNNYFNNVATFCAGTNERGREYRNFIGTLSNMSVELKYPLFYTIHFDANGQNGTMPDQIVALGKHTTINTNQFTSGYNLFNGWNTEPDGTGTSYPDNYQITSDLGQEGDVITLYAQWVPAGNYNIHFDANGGTGTMNNQPFPIGGNPTPLTANTFTRTNYEFRGWNTAPDGTGTHYDNMEAVSNLSNTNGDVITLYAEWWKIQYVHNGDAVFDGTAGTFIDTGVNVFSSTNINKDFEIRFTFKSVDSDQMQVTPQQPTIFNVKDESNNKYPGFNIRFESGTGKMYPTYRWGGNTVKVPTNGIETSHAPIEFIYKRHNGVITIQYSYQDFTSNVISTINQSSWNLNQSFATNVAFGGYFDSNNNPGRFFKGTLADMIILMDD